MIRTHRLLLALFLAFPLFGAVLVRVEPAGPTTATPVTLYVLVPCGGSSHTVQSTGTTIDIVVLGGGGANCDDYAGTPYAVSLGSLPSGLYTARATVAAAGNRQFVEQFVVREAAPPFQVHPFAVSTASPPPRSTISSFTYSCKKPCTVRVGGADAVVQSQYEDLRFTPPVLPPGLYDVSVTDATGTVVAPSAMYYFDPAAPPETSVFEPVLFPVIASSNGAFGSQWVSEAVISNPKPWTVVNYNSLYEGVCALASCEELRSGYNEKLLGGTYARGVNLLVPRRDATSLSFGLRVRDVSKTQLGFGTEVPVIREKDLYRGQPLTLLNVPIDPRYRSLLRIYGIDESTADKFDVVVAIRKAPRDVQGVFNGLVTLERSCSEKTCASTPAYGQMLLPSGAEGEFVDIYVHPYFPLSFWAFVSVTNNETQQVTIVTPDGEGGEACVVCPP